MITQSAAASALLALVLGSRHGMDADHLAAIDGLTRWNSTNPRLAPLCGVLFSAGHVGVILTVAVALAVMSGQFVPPEWLKPLGTLVSGVTLLLLGALNLRAVFAGDEVRAAVGLRARFMSSLFRASRSWRIAVVGALFALSFDAFAIAALFASTREGVGSVLVSAVCFGAGMLAVGAANGVWVVRLVRHSQHSRRRAARVMMLTIAIVAFLVSARVLIPLASAPLDRWAEEYEWIISAGVITVVFAGYFISLWAARRSRDGRPGHLAGTADISS